MHIHVAVLWGQRLIQLRYDYQLIAAFDPHNLPGGADIQKRMAPWSLDSGVHGQLPGAVVTAWTPRLWSTAICIQHAYNDDLKLSQPALHDASSIASDRHTNGAPMAYSSVISTVHFFSGFFALAHAISIP